MAIAGGRGGGRRRRAQEGGTGSVSGATRSSPSRTVYKAPTQDGFVFVTEDGNVLSPMSVRQSLAAGLITVVNGIPPVLEQIAVGGILPVTFSTGLASPQITGPAPLQPDAQPPADDGDAGGGGGIGGSRGASRSTEQTFQPIAPPVTDILRIMSDRRQAVRDAALANFGAVQGAAPQMVNPDVRFFPGLEPGGIASMALGQSSGLGTEAAESLIPTATREFFRVPLPGLASPQEPTLQSEFGGALGLAKQILDAIRLFQTGTASSSQSGGGGGGGGGSGLSLDSQFIASIIGETVGP